MPQDQDGEMEARRKRPRLDREPLAQDGESVERSPEEEESHEPLLAQDGESVERAQTGAAGAPEEEEESAGFTSLPATMAALPGSGRDSSGSTPDVAVPPKDKEESPGPSSDVDDLSEEMKDRFRQIMTRSAANRPNNAAEVRRESVDCYNRTVENEFCDVDDGSFQSCKARKVAALASKSVVSLSSFSGEKRTRVCSGFMIEFDPSTNRSRILTSATLVRSLCGRNILIPDLKVKVGLPNGQISDGLISMVDFHYNLAVVEVKSDEKLPEAVLVEKVIEKGAVLAIGRFYDHGRVMCAQGMIRKQASTFDCSELLVSSCHTTMAGVGGPLVNYSGHVVGINFYGENHTPFLSTAVIIRCLKHWKIYGKIIRPWLGLVYTSVDMLPLRILENCTYFDKGLYISKVAKGSPADVAGLCVGDVLIECAGKVLSTAPELGAVLLDLCNKQMGSYTSESNVTVEFVVRKQRNDKNERKTVIANVLSECSYYSWLDPLPTYNDKKMAPMQFMSY